MDSDFRDGGAFFLYGNGLSRKYRMNQKRTSSDQEARLGGRSLGREL